MKIKNLRKEIRGVEVALVADIENISFKTMPPHDNTIWVSVPDKYSECLATDRYDGFLVALLYPAMAYGEDIEIDGAVSKRLLRNINVFVQDILLAYNDKLQRIDIKARETTSQLISSAKHIGTGFSGGVDSFSTIYDNYVLENDPEYKIDTLVCLNVGSHGEYGDAETFKMFENRCVFLKQYADAVGLPFIPVDSNIHVYHEWGHQLTHSLTLTSGILTLQGMFSKYYVASVGWNYNQWIIEAAKQRNHDIGEFSEPYLLPLLSTESTEFVLDGMQYTRVQKTLNISNYPLTKKFLNVCVVNEPQVKNCGRCDKCARVGLTLSAVGKLDEYKDVFDISTYKKNEQRLMCRAVQTFKSNPFMADILDLAKKVGKKYPSRFYVFLRSTVAHLKRFKHRTQDKMKAIVRAFVRTCLP